MLTGLIKSALVIAAPALLLRAGSGRPLEPAVAAALAGVLAGRGRWQAGRVRGR